MRSTFAEKIKNEILSSECDYEYICKSLTDDFESTIAGILKSFRRLLKHMDEDNKNVFNTLIKILNTHLKKKKNKNDLEFLYNKIDEFLSNLSNSFNESKLLELEEYISTLIDIQNKCLLNPFKKHKSDRYNFMMYLIFENKNIELLSKYINNNMKELLINNSLLSSVFASVIEKYISINSENKPLINHYNQIINLFLNGKLYDRLFKSNGSIFIDILKSSDKDFVWDLIDRLENDLLITKEDLAREYNVSFTFPKDLEEFTFSSRKAVDFTYQNIITIDNNGDTCLDDALYVRENTNGTNTLYFHLTNPPSIIPYSSNTMQEALKRTETIYLEDMEIPIFKEELSNNILSILPNKKTNTLTFIVDVDTDFSIILDTVKVVPGVVINRNKLSYEEVDEILKRADNDELSKQIILLSQICNKLSRSQLKILAYHKLENLTKEKKKIHLSSDLSPSHLIVENSMIFVNRLPDILDKYHHLNLIFPYRVQPECTDKCITDILENIENIDPNSSTFRKIAKNYMFPSKYSPVNIGHIGLGVNGYVRIGSAARRAMDALALYILDDLYINRNKGDLDIKYYYWEKEIKYWCEYANNRISENNIFAEEYNYLKSKGKILKK